MKKRKNIIANIIIAAMTMGLLFGCGKAETQNAVPKEDVAIENEVDVDVVEPEKSDDAETEAAGSDITILYTNDVHSYVANVVKDNDGNITGDGLRLSKVAAMLNDMRAAGENVLLVDAGDEIQGDIYGAMDEGETIINLMKATGYQLATPGNHDFDYGVIQFLKLAETAGFPYVTCNFHSTKTREIIFADSYTFEIAGKKVAFVGVSTPSTITSSTPVYFQDETGEFIYTVDGLKDKKDLYVSVQNAIDRVKDDADYVIGIGHLGVGIEETKKGWDSKSVIANVSGLDAFIDGHSHTVLENEKVKNKKTINMPEMEEAAERVIMGPERKSRVMSDKDKRLTAYHEGGHTLVGMLLEHTDRVHKVTIIPRGRAGGYTLSLPEEDKYYATRSEMLDELKVLLGGRVAEAIVLEDISSGASNDLQRATQLARSMICEYGMSENIGPVTFGSHDHQVFLGRDIARDKDYSEEVAAEIDKEVRAFLENAYTQTEALINNNIDKLHAIASALIEHETLEEYQIKEIMDYGHILTNEEKTLNDIHGKT